MPVPFRYRNPLTMRADLDRCWLFAYRTDPAEARRRLPSGLEPVLHGGFAYWNVVVSHLRAMRPAGLPAAFGVSYWHLGYRFYARLRTPRVGPAVEGLYFVRSDCDHRLMALAGDLLTDFRFHRARIEVQAGPAAVSIAVGSADAPGEVRLRREAPATLPPGSPFGSVDEAASALKYRPFGISVDPAGRRANVVRIVRDEAAWRARPVTVEHEHWAVLAGTDARLELAYEVDPIPYVWRRGRICRLR